VQKKKEIRKFIVSPQSEVTCICEQMSLSGFQLARRSHQRQALHKLESPPTTTTALKNNGYQRATMLLLRRHIRFIILLSFLLAASLLLLLSRPPFVALQPTSRGPAEPSPRFQDLAARVQRAERAYQKMLLGRDALITKVGPAPGNVALFVLFFSST
jgi:hypothetical protein